MLPFLGPILLTLCTGVTMPPTAAPSDGARLRRIIERCDGDHELFIRNVLGDRGMWDKQLEVLESVRKYPITLVPAGNSVGKSYLAARLILSFFLQHRDSVVFVTGPAQGQLNTVVFGEVSSAIEKAPIPLGIGAKGSGPITINLTDRWFVKGHVTNKIENTTGYHRYHLLGVVDEGSGVAELAYEGLWSLNPSRIVVFGNPLRPTGRFHSLCMDALAEAHKPDRTSNVIRIPSTDSPDIHLDRSLRGLADKGFLDRNRRDYGEGSIWWLSHILAQFPDVVAEMLCPGSWADLAAKSLHLKGGPARIAIDLAGGNGGDRTVILCRDDNGLLDLRWNAHWSLEETARQVKAVSQLHAVDPGRISYDLASIGWDFANRLDAEGLGAARSYTGGTPVENCANLRSAAARELRYRLDPGRKVMNAQGLIVPQIPFSFNPGRPDWFAEIRPELVGVMRFLDKYGRYALELSGDMRERMKRSPDFFDALCQSFAFPEM